MVHFLYRGEMSDEQLGQYRLIEHIATGGMGEVYLAHRGGVAGFAKAVVVKRLRDDLASDPDFVEMFLNEGRLAALLDHSNIVPIFELGEFEGTYFMAMEYVAGTDLGRLLAAVGDRLELAEALYVMRNICEGLAFAHDARGADGRPMRLVHRDITPQNVLISAAGAVKIADFGIAKVAQQQQQTQAGRLKGKFGYLSPEQARGLPIDRRSDIYNLGLLLFEMTVGRCAVPVGTDAQMLEAAANGLLVQPQELLEDYPPALAAIYRKATAWRVEDRYQSVPQLQEDLLEYQMDNRLLATPQRIAELVEQHFSENIARERRALNPDAFREEDPTVDELPEQATRIERPPGTAPPPRGSVPSVPAMDPADYMGPPESTAVMDSDEADLSVPTAVTSPSELGYADTVAFRRNDDPPAPVAPEEEVTRDDIHHAWATQAKEATPAVPTSSPNALNSAPTEQIPDGYARPGGLASTVSTENTTRHRKVGAEELFGAADPLANLPSEELTAELDAKTSIFRQDSAQFPRDTVPGPQDSGTQDTPQAKPAHRWTGESDISVELDMTPQSIPAVANPAVAVEGKTSQEIDGPPAPRASETTARRVVARGSRWVLLVVLALLVMAAAAAAGHFYKQHRQRESQRKTPADTRPMERSSATPSPRSAADASSR